MGRGPSTREPFALTVDERSIAPTNSATEDDHEVRNSGGHSGGAVRKNGVEGAEAERKEVVTGVEHQAGDDLFQKGVVDQRGRYCGWIRVIKQDTEEENQSGAPVGGVERQ